MVTEGVKEGFLEAVFGGVLARTEQVWYATVAVWASKSVARLPAHEGERTPTPCQSLGWGVTLDALCLYPDAGRDDAWTLRSCGDVQTAAPASAAETQEWKNAIQTSLIPIRGLFSYRRASPILNSFKLFRVPIRLLILLFPPAARGCVWFAFNQS